MRKLIRIIVFMAIGIIPLALLYSYLMAKGYSPLLSDRMSYDAKINFAIQQGVDHADVLAIGSSVTLNNLHSETLKAHIGPERSYFNLASWGLKMTHHLSVIKTYLAYYDPETIIIVSAPRDFMQETVPFDDDMFLLGYLYELYPYFFLRHPDLRETVSRDRWSLDCREDQSTFSSLAYDDWGGVIFHIPDTSERLQKRQHQSTWLDVTEEQYQALGKLCQVLTRRKVKLVFVQSFIKQENCASAECQAKLGQHIARTQEIVTSNQQTYINMYPEGLNCPDSLFADDIHLNFGGSRYFTERLTAKMDAQGIAIKEGSMVN